MCHNAQYQLQAHLLGKVVALSSGETRLAGSINALPNVVGRTWEYWTMRLGDAGRMPEQSSRGAGRRNPARSRKKPGAAKAKTVRPRRR
jgi:hypothetical protein